MKSDAGDKKTCKNSWLTVVLEIHVVKNTDMWLGNCLSRMVNNKVIGVNTIQ